MERIGLTAASAALFVDHNDYRGVVDMWLEVRSENFVLREWKEAMAFLSIQSFS